MSDVNLDFAVMAADCALRGDHFVITHIASDAERFSGWTISCARDHDHGERTFVPVRTLVETFPQVARYLTLPVGASVLFGAGEPRVLYGQEPRRYPRHRWLGAFMVSERLLASDGREPVADVALGARPGQWHAYLRVARDGTHQALMAIHSEFLDRANDMAFTHGGDHAQGIASLVRSARCEATADWQSLKNSSRSPRGISSDALPGRSRSSSRAGASVRSASGSGTRAHRGASGSATARSACQAAAAGRRRPATTAGRSTRCARESRP
jgi:hypothetical protein